jgi:hypothetical protein
MKEPVELHEDTARALRMLGQAAPPEGMEARLVGRLQQRRAESNVAGRAGLNIFSGRMVLAGAMVAACVMVAVLARHRPNVAKRDVVADVRAVASASPRAVTKPAVYGPVKATRHVRISRAPVEHNRQVSFPGPEEPLTEQERLLLRLARAPGPALGAVTTTETVVDHGLGENAIFEIDHEELAQLKTTLQLTSLRNTLPPPNHPGDTE